MASGGFSAFDAEKLRALGGFNPLLAPFYWEDVDLSLRAWRRGWKVLYEPRAVVYHATSSTIGARFRSAEVEFIAQRNRLITHWVNLHDRWWFAQHLGMVVLTLLASLLSLRRTFWRAFVAAAMELPKVLEQRQRERVAVKLSDRELARLMASAVSRSDVFLLEGQSRS
jgi:GT2 family glycosyltransferase